MSKDDTNINRIVKEIFSHWTHLSNDCKKVAAASSADKDSPANERRRMEMRFFIQSALNAICLEVRPAFFEHIISAFHYPQGLMVKALNREWSLGRALLSMWRDQPGLSRNFFTGICGQFSSDLIRMAIADWCICVLYMAIRVDTRNERVKYRKMEKFEKFSILKYAFFNVFIFTNFHKIL